MNDLNRNSAMYDFNSNTTPHIYGTPNTGPNTEDFFAASQQFKKQKCRWGFVKCCGGMAICVALNAVSFYLGVKYGMDDENSAHSAHSSHSN